MRQKQTDDFYYRKQAWEARKLRDKYNYIREHGFINACKNGMIKNIKLSNSGGKDSIALMAWCKDNKIDEYVNITTQTINTSIDFYGIEDYIIYIIKKLKLKCDSEFLYQKDEKKSREKVLELAKKYAVPMSVRYCNSILKKSLFHRLENYDKFDITLIGCRWSESTSRSKNTRLYYSEFQLNYQPILHFKLIDVLNILKKYELPLFYSYEYITRLSCVLCPLIFLRTKLSVNCVYAQKNKDKFDYDFSVKFLDSINKACEMNIDSHRGALRDQMKLFMLNYNRFKKVEYDKIDIIKNDWDIDFWRLKN